MKRTFLILVAALAVMAVFAVPVMAAPHEGNPGGNCDPGIEKIETNDASIVLPAGTIFCVKQSDSNTGTLVADGVTTLGEYAEAAGLGNGVSNYVIYAVATPTPTPTPTPVASPTPTPVASPTPTPVASPTPTPVASPTPTPVATPSPTPPDATPTPTPPDATPSPTPTDTLPPTDTVGSTGSSSPAPWLPILLIVVVGTVASYTVLRKRT